MSNVTQLRLMAREIFADALREADAGGAVRKAIRLERSVLKICDATLDLEDRRVYSIAIGKAALPMALALQDAFGERLHEGLIVGPTARQPLIGEIVAPPRQFSTRWQSCDGGHPLPNEDSLAAAELSFALLRRAHEERTLVIFLLSGGGSAMLEWPSEETITLADLRLANRTLINCGASISEINAVRRAFSAVKGGKLAARAPHCDQVTLIVSDVPSDEERSVASGPTLDPLLNAPDAGAVIDRYHLRSQLPDSIIRAIQAERYASVAHVKTTSIRKHFVLLDNRDALEAALEAAQRRGFVAEIAADISDHAIEKGCAKLLASLTRCRHAGDLSKSLCLISGGEFACPVRGNGIGGRNQETALRLAIESDKLARQNDMSSFPFVALCAGTDGIDGNSPAAGAIIDSTTIQRAHAVGLDPEDFLERSDAFSFFLALGDAITTGATGTNVRDLRILLVGAHD